MSVNLLKTLGVPGVVNWIPGRYEGNNQFEAFMKFYSHDTAVLIASVMASPTRAMSASR